MELRLQLLDTFRARGPDGASYKVCAYDRLARDPTAAGDDGRWEPTGQLEYRLEDGRLVESDHEGRLFVAATGMWLEPQPQPGGDAGP